MPTDDMSWWTQKADPSAPPPVTSESDYGVENVVSLPGATRPYVNGHAVADAPARLPALWTLTEPWLVADIPRRPWIARGYLMRGAITVLSGPPSAGKSSLAVAWAAALAVGSSFHRMKVSSPMKVATYNVEDDLDEQKRRFSALLAMMELSPLSMRGNLAIIGPSQVGTLLHSGIDGGRVVRTDVMERLCEFIDEFKPDVLFLDPFVELHSAEENDNTAVRGVLACFRAIATHYNISVVILHHSRKGLNSPGDPDSLRGASAIVGAARIALTVNIMTTDEAAEFKIAERRRRDFFRLDTAKSNYAPIEDAEWFERHEVKLLNGPDGIDGDGVAAAWPWKPPGSGDLTPATINRVLDIIAAGIDGAPFAPSMAGKNNQRWVGFVIMEHLSCTDGRAKALLQEWLSEGMVVKSSYFDAEQRKDKIGISVVDSLRPS